MCGIEVFLFMKEICSDHISVYQSKADSSLENLIKQYPIKHMYTSSDVRLKLIILQYDKLNKKKSDFKASENTESVSLRKSKRNHKIPIRSDYKQLSDSEDEALVEESSNNSAN